VWEGRGEEGGMDEGRSEFSEVYSHRRCRVIARVIADDAAMTGTSPRMGFLWASSPPLPRPPNIRTGSTPERL